MVVIAYISIGLLAGAVGCVIAELLHRYTPLSWTAGGVASGVAIVALFNGMLSLTHTTFHGAFPIIGILGLVGSLAGSIQSRSRAEAPVTAPPTTLETILQEERKNAARRTDTDHPAFEAVPTL